MGRPYTPAYERVVPRLRIDESGCHVWPGAQSYRDGYGIVGVRVDDRWTVRPVHRVVWEATRGPIPQGLEIDHLCRNRLCANPAHLEVVTHATNMERMAGNVCRHGHPRTPENSSINKEGARICRVCRRIAVNRSRNRSKND
jgi:hypothetical protein